MNWAQFKDPISHTCLAGTVVACWSLTQEVAGLSLFNITNFLSLNSVKNIWEKLHYCLRLYSELVTSESNTVCYTKCYVPNFGTPINLLQQNA